jgi:hypothetical protein
MKPTLEKGMEPSLAPVVVLTRIEDVLRSRLGIDASPPLEDPGLPDGVELPTKLLEGRNPGAEEGMRNPSGPGEIS